MAYYATNIVTGNVAAVALTVAQFLKRPPVLPEIGGEVVAQHTRIDFASGTNLAINDVVELGILPSDCVPVDFALFSNQFDSNATPTLASNIGVMTGTPGDATRIQTAVGTEGAAAMKWGSVDGCVARAGQSNGTASALTLVQYATTLIRQAPSTTADRSIGMAVTAAAATNPATTRRLDFILWYRISNYGV